jgi:hypothetical protein
MKKVIKLTESDLARIVKRVIKENDEESENTVDLEQRFEDLIEDAFDLFEQEGIPHEEYIMYSEEDVINAVREIDSDLAEEMSEIWDQIG